MLLHDVWTQWFYISIFLCMHLYIPVPIRSPLLDAHLVYALL